jgi:hypothetical protein
MAGFKKAKAEQAALKVGIYGPPGSGKTFTALLFAEGLAALTKKRIAFVDTERGTDFYVQPVAARAVHPEAFDVDALYTRSITEIADAVRGLDPAVHGVVILDSVTHVWEAARAAYAGRETKAGTIPFHAWAKIKKPYKDLMAFLLNSPMHVFILGRQGNEFEEDEETGETKKVGVKMKAEGETAYEPHILLRMEAVRQKDGAAIPTAFAEKDRTGILQGRVFANPAFDTCIKPLLPLLGATQAQVASAEETANADAERLGEQEAARVAESADLVRTISAKIALAGTTSELNTVGKEITPEVKKRLVAADLDAIKATYREREAALGRK